MIDNKYIEQLDAQDKRWFDYLIKYKGSEIVALNSLLHDLDCTRVYKDGSRPVQTINYGYKRDIAGFIYIYNKLCESYLECNVDYYAKLVKRHEDNLSFEEANGVTYYTKKQRTSTRSSKKYDETTDIFTGERFNIRTGVAKIVKQKKMQALVKLKL